MEFGGGGNSFGPYRSNVTRPTYDEAQIGIYSFHEKNDSTYRNWYVIWITDLIKYFDVPLYVLLHQYVLFIDSSPMLYKVCDLNSIIK